MAELLIGAGAGGGVLLLVRLDPASGYGAQLPDTEFWKMDGSKSLMTREEM